MPEALPIFTEAHARLILAAYISQNRPLDQLPYTDEFEVIYRQINPHVVVTRNGLWRWLSNQRKAKKLPVLRKARKPGGGNPPVDDSGP